MSHRRSLPSLSVTSAPSSVSLTSSADNPLVTVTPAACAASVKIRASSGRKMPMVGLAPGHSGRLGLALS